jgi:hypothetical protein
LRKRPRLFRRPHQTSTSAGASTSGLHDRGSTPAEHLIKNAIEIGFRERTVTKAQFPGGSSPLGAPMLLCGVKAPRRSHLHNSEAAEARWSDANIWGTRKQSAPDRFPSERCLRFLPFARYIVGNLENQRDCLAVDSTQHGPFISELLSASRPNSRPTQQTHQRHVRCGAQPECVVGSGIPAEEVEDRTNPQDIYQCRTA